MFEIYKMYILSHCSNLSNLVIFRQIIGKLAGAFRNGLETGPASPSGRRALRQAAQMGHVERESTFLEKERADPWAA